MKWTGEGEIAPAGIFVLALVGDFVFSSCVDVVDLRLSDSEVTLVFLLRVASTLPAYSNAEIPGWPNIGNEFNKCSVDVEENMFTTG